MAELKITKKDALRLLAEAVEKKGRDYVDPNAADGDCTYLDTAGRRPGCIVGHALHAAGVKPKVLRDLDHLTVSGFGAEEPIVVATLAEKGVALTGGAVAVFREAQIKQDDGMSWGVALTAAREA